MKIAIDRGGTFTDVYAEYDRKEIVFKLLSVDPANYPDAPTEGIRRVLELSSGTKISKGTPLDLSNVESIRMGTTVATNALLERKGDRVAILVSKGFRDILRIGQQARPDIFDLKVRKLEQLYEVVEEVDERVTLEHFTESPDPTPSFEKGQEGLVQGISGETIRILTPIDTGKARKQLQTLWDRGIRSLAIAYMHSYTFPDHEQKTAEIAQEIGFEDISVSSSIQPMIKLVSRANSAAADAYLSPIVTRYIRTIGDGFKGGLDALGDRLLFMQSDGGLTSWKQFSGLKAILSGPAGGVVGYAQTSYSDKAVLGFDMGGTSTDVSRYSGRLNHVLETTTAQVTIQAPQLDIHTVAAGGGSILFWKKGLFVVGPESASAHPGPACYRKGGPLTVTDANLFMGRIDVESFPHIFGPHENEPLDVEIVKRKFHDLTNTINKDFDNKLSPEQVAQGFLSVANEQMCRPIRALTEGKGHSTSDHVLSSFGGAGGQHACDVARNLGIAEVIIHKHSSILSAFGMSLADIVSDVQLPESTALNKNALEGLNQRLDELEAEARHNLIDQGLHSNSIVCERYLNLKYKGSETFLMILQLEGHDFEKDFIETHKKEFGFSLEREILVGDIRVRAIARSLYDRSSLLPQLAQNTTQPEPSNYQDMYFGEWVKASKYKLKDLVPGNLIRGPAMILDETQTIVVTLNSEAVIAPNHVILRLTDASAAKIDDSTIDPIQLSVFGHRFMSIAEQMGQTLRQTAISTNIKERLDFSCAIFGPDGGLVANAPHIPVHLGSMSSAVAYQAEFWRGKLVDGDVLVANHPAYGGSHLPDITVITPVFENGDIIFWVASRGHHSDIGGITAGSMPPFSKYLWQEGACIKTFKVVSDGKFDLEGVVERFYNEPSKYPGCSGSRSLSDSISDLKAQIAANYRGITLVKSLCADAGLKVVQLYMNGIRDNAELSVRELLKAVAARHGTTLHAKDYIDDGTQMVLEVTIDPETGSATFDFEGTGPQLYGNLNAPISTTHSAILYCLRTMISEDIPLNQGCLKPLNIKIPYESFLSPREDAATVAATTETSQRVTDVVFRAFRALAASQGSCNNFTFGFGGKDKKGFGYYETIAGGAGAGPSWHGQSGVQVHMTNTRSTDPEIFEKRYPVILREFSIRSGSGGNGKYRGGDGIIRDVEFRHPVQASILSERRSFAPWGLDGGHAAQRGENLWISDGRVWNIGGKNTIDAKCGDRIIIKTPGGGGYGAPEPQQS